MNDPSRLGPRRNKRDYALEQRSTGKDAGDVMKERDMVKYAGVLVVVAIACLNTKDTAAYYLIMHMAVFTLAVAVEIRRPRLVAPTPIPKVRLDWDDLTDAEYESKLGMSKEEAQDQYDVMGFPDRVQLNEGRHAFRVDGVHAFLYYMYRIHTPNQRVKNEEEGWGYHSSVLSKILWAVAKFIDETHGHRLRQLPDQVHRFSQWNGKIRTKLSHLYPFDPMPPHALDCALFGDGTRIQTARPAGPYWLQYGAFSADKWYHCHGAQGIFAPDGLFYDWYDACLGKDGDKIFMRDSGVNAILAHIQLGAPIQHWVYCDAGYDDRTHVRCASHGPGPVTAQEKEDNKKMSRVRIGVEWGFGVVYARCPYLRHPALLKLQAVDVALLVRACVIMTNAYNCRHQSNTAKYFDCKAPTLAAYFA